MDLTMRRLPVAAVPWRLVGVALLLAALLATALYAGSQRRVPPPFGPARNGPIVYSNNGDVYVRDGLDAAPRLLLGGPGDDAYATYSPDGTRVLYSTTLGEREVLKAANADGSNAVQVFEEPIVDAATAWAPDSRSIALITTRMGFSTLFVVAADGSGSRQVELGTLVPRDVQWRPPTGETLLVRASGPRGVDLYSVRPDGTELKPLGLTSRQLFGERWDLGGSVWSPDGRTIAYNAVDQNPTTGVVRFRVHLVNPDGSNDRPVAAPPSDDIHEAWPQFSPDGRSILVHRWTWSRDAGGSGDGEGWLAVLPADGTVVGHDIGKHFPGGEHTGLTELWSPDGTRVFVRVDNSQDVYAFDVSGGTWTQLDWAGFDLPDVQRLAP